MVPSDETGRDTSGSIIRAERAASRRELLRNKRGRNTDMLPVLTTENGHSKASHSTLAYLREENARLYREVESLQEQLATYSSSMDLLDSEIETIHHAHQQEIEQYQQHLRDMMNEHNQMQEANQEWEKRYQELYRSFHDAVEEEANKMVQEAAQTLVLSPEHTPALLSDVVKTLESQVKQTEDQRTAELLGVMRQALYKSEMLEQEVARERNELAAERENLHALRASISQQAQQRFQTERAGLRARWTAGLTFISIVLFSLMVALELLFYSFHVDLAITLFVPLAICMVLSYIFAHMHTTGRLRVHMRPAPAKKPGAKVVQATKPKAKTSTPTKQGA